MCMFSALSPGFTVSFLIAVTLLFFSIPLIDKVRRLRSPLITQFIQHIQITNSSKSEIGISLCNAKQRVLTIEKLGYMPVHATTWAVNSYKEKSVIWIENSSRNLFPIKLAPHEKKNIYLELQEIDSSLSPLEYVWIFSIDGKNYYRDSSQKDILRLFD